MRFIHVNQHVDARNKKHGRTDPCLTVKEGRRNRYAREVWILDPDGYAVVWVRYRPTEPLPSGARCWVDTNGPLVLSEGDRAVAALPAGHRHIHVSKHAIKHNQKSPAEPVPILTITSDLGSWLADEVLVRDRHGREAARVTYRPHKPLPCGARCWVETTNPVRLLDEVPSPGRR